VEGHVFARKVFSRGAFIKGDWGRGGIFKGWSREPRPGEKEGVFITRGDGGVAEGMAVMDLSPASVGKR